MIKLWIGFNLTDLVLTCFLIQGGARELNPLLAIFNYNLLALAICKIILTIAVLIFLGIIKKLHLFKWLNTCMVLVIIWNLGCLIMQVYSRFDL